MDEFRGSMLEIIKPHMNRGNTLEINSDGMSGTASIDISHISKIDSSQANYSDLSILKLINPEHEDIYDEETLVFISQRCD